MKKLTDPRFGRIGKGSQQSYDLTGHRFGLLVATTSEVKLRARWWFCQCDCGGTKWVKVDRLTAIEPTKSCGCLLRKRGPLRWPPSPTRASWASMRTRCENPRRKNFKNYGGRGIRVCERWLSFALFVADMGERPIGTSLDRIDVNGDYEPGNCRWSTALEQGQNKRGNILLELDGESLTVAAWAAHLGVSRYTLYDRVRRGLSAEQVLRPSMCGRPFTPTPDRAE